MTYLLAQIEAGAEAVMLFDSWAGMLSPAQFRRHVIEPAQAIVDAAAAAHPDRAGHRVSSAGGPAGRRLCDGDRGGRRSGWIPSMDPGLAGRVIPARTALQGNLDPLALVAGGTGIAA